jgi:phytoene dehydrogenase-like protein
MRALHFVRALSLLASAVAVVTAADAGPNPATKKERAKPAIAVTAQQEAEVLQFLRQHHTELAELLGHLQLSRPADYNRAIRDIGHARERLRQFEKGDGERYELELQSWVIQSKIQLLVARLAMSDSESLRDELRHLLAEQFDLKLRLSQVERDRTAERLQKLDEQLRRLADSRAELLEKEFLSLTKSSERLKAKRKDATAAKPAGKSTP